MSQEVDMEIEGENKEIEKVVDTNDGNIENEKKLDNSDSLKLGINYCSDGKLRISVIPPELDSSLSRLPVKIVCVVDVSGSMSTEAKTKDINGKEEESDGLSILDLVKHSVKTIIECLNDKDSVSIITYSNVAKVQLSLCKLNKKNKKKALSILDSMNASGGTNLWDGLYYGLEEFRKDKNSLYSNCGVLLFTDGLPNVIPPKGHETMLAEYIDKNGLNCIVNTYGFGYSLDSKLLNNIAIKGNGSYFFIPDSSFVGTIFVNSISNFCSNYGKNVKLKISLNNDTSENNDSVNVMGNYNCIRTSWGMELYLGSIMFGQQKNVILEYKGEGKLNYDINKNSLEYISLKSNKLINDNTVVNTDNNTKLTEEHYIRLLLCDNINECIELNNINSNKESEQLIKKLIKSIKNNKKINIKNNKYMKDVLLDLSGQVYEAISNKEYYKKWGRHYLLSLVFAHLHEYNNNFKDPGVQHYGGKLFKEIRDKANNIFIKLPPPKPSIKKYKYNNNNKNNKNNSYKPINMSKYYNVGGGCFSGNNLVLMKDNTLKLIKDLIVGDEILSSNNLTSKIKCIIRYKCKNDKIILSTINNNLKITPWHPIKLNNEWIFPDSLDSGKLEECDYVFNFVLDNNHIIIVNGIECCTLGHNFIDNNIIKHSYFGTNKVIDDLKQINGWDSGFICLSYGAMLRDKNSNLVNGISTLN